MTEKRRAQRILLNAPTSIEVIRQPEIELPAPLAAVYERVQSGNQFMGERFPGVVRDLSTNGAFIASEPLPLLARVSFTFPLEGYGQVDAVGWVLWRRRDDCDIPAAAGPVRLSKGFGVLFEAIPLDARLHIHELVRAAAE
jgi:PilZ domain-containing protein